MKDCPLCERSRRTSFVDDLKNQKIHAHQKERFLLFAFSLQPRLAKTNFFTHINFLHEIRETCREKWFSFSVNQTENQEESDI